MPLVIPLSADFDDQVWPFRASELFTPAEKAALEFGYAAAGAPGAVDERVAQELRRHGADGARWLAAQGWSAGKHAPSAG